jgi:endonuclease/exonuclease/phosphatase family metal-dependent hydrolase
VTGHARGLFREAAPDLPVPPLRVRERLKTIARGEEAHRAAMLALPCMTMLAHRPGSPRPIAFPFTVGAWNLERCLSPETSADVLRREGVAVALLSELDVGMARTGQRDTTRILADALGLASAYGVEFLELDLGNPVERAFCTDDANAAGFHGNALLAPALGHPFLVRLDDHGPWFAATSPEARIGGRCAIGGWVETALGPVLAVSAHLESSATPEARGAAFAFLLDAVEAEAGGRPVLLGGDLNTGLGAGGGWEAEPLIHDAQARGFALHSGDIAQTTTRASRIARDPTGAWKLDWILTCGLATGPSRIVPALAPDGTVLSDHDLVTLEITGLA